MWNRYAMPVHGVAPGIGYGRLDFMNHQLMAKEIEVNPVAVTPALRAAEDFTVEPLAGGQVRHRDGQVKRCAGHGRHQRISTPTRAASGRPGRAPKGRRETT